jgi:hypothetical protein
MKPQRWCSALLLGAFACGNEGLPTQGDDAKPLAVRASITESPLRILYGRDAFRAYVQDVRTELIRMAKKGRKDGRLTRAEAEHLRSLQAAMTSLRERSSDITPYVFGPGGMASVFEWQGTTTAGGDGTGGFVDVWSDATGAQNFYSLAGTTGWVMDGYSQQIGSGSFPWSTYACCSILASKFVQISNTGCYTMTGSSSHMLAQGPFPNPPGDDIYESSSRISNNQATWGSCGGGGSGGTECTMETFTVEVGYYNESGGITWQFYDTFQAEVCEYET